MRNEKIRSALTRNNMKQWELAEILCVNEFSLSRKLRHELPPEEQDRIVALIKEHATGNKEGADSARKEKQNADQ